MSLEPIGFVFSSLAFFSAAAAILTFSTVVRMVTTSLVPAALRR